MSGSGWSSGCESGWTGYFEESYIPTNEYTSHSHNYRLNSRSDEDDMSMVSDASSGPRHFREDGTEESYHRSNIQECYSNSVKSCKKSSDKRSKKTSGKDKKLSKQQNQHCFSSSNNNNYLDDTASSPGFTYNSKMFDNSSSCNQASVDNFMNFPQGISEAHFQESSSYSNQYNFWQSSFPKDTHSAEAAGQLRGGRWE